MAEGTGFGPVGGAPFGGLVVGGVVYTVAADGSAIRPGLEQARRIANQLNPEIQAQLTFAPKIDTAPATQQLRQLEQQATQSNAVLRRLQEQEAARPAAFARAQAESIGTPTSGPLGLRAALNAPLPLDQTARFGRSVEDIAARFRTTEQQAASSLGRIGRGFDALAERASSASQEISRGFGGAFLGGFAGVTLGAEAFRALTGAITGSISVSLQQQQINLGLNRSFGAQADQIRAAADAQAAALHRSNLEFREATLLTATVSREYGISASQQRELIRISADLAAATGRSLPDVTQRLTAALRGEAESAEPLGLVLNDAAVASRAADGAYKGMFATLTDGQKAQLRFAELERQSAAFAGSAAERAASAAGAYDRLGAAAEKAGTRLGAGAGSIGAVVANQLAAGIEGIVRTGEAVDDLAGSWERARDAMLRYLQSRPSGEFSGGPPGFGAGGGGGAGGFESAEAATGNLTREQAEYVEQVRKSAGSWTAVIDAVEAEGDAFTRWADRKTQRQEALNKELERMGSLIEAAQRVGDPFERLAANQKSTTDELTRQHQSTQDAIRAAIEGVKPEEQAALIEKLRAANPIATQGALDEIANDPTTRIREIANAQTEEAKRSKQVQDQLARDAERRAQAGEDARIEDIRDRGEAEVQAAQDAINAERDRHAAVSESLRDESEQRQRINEDRQQQLAVDRQLADSARQQTEAARGLADAHGQLARAQTGVGRPGDAARTVGQQAEAIRNAQRQVEEAKRAAEVARLQQGEAALEAAGQGNAGILSDAQRQEQIARLRQQLAARQGLTAEERRAAEELLALAQRPREQLTPEQRAAVDQALGTTLSQQERDAQRKEREQQREEDKLNRENTTRLEQVQRQRREAAEKDLEAARKQVEAARESRETVAAWGRLGFAPPGSVGLVPAQPQAADGGATAPIAAPPPAAPPVAFPPAGVPGGGRLVQVIYQAPVTIGAGGMGVEEFTRAQVTAIQQAELQVGVTP